MGKIETKTVQEVPAGGGRRDNAGEWAGHCLLDVGFPLEVMKHFWN